MTIKHTANIPKNIFACKFISLRALRVWREVKLYTEQSGHLHVKQYDHSLHKP